MPDTLQAAGWPGSGQRVPGHTRGRLCEPGPVRGRGRQCDLGPKCEHSAHRPVVWERHAHLMNVSENLLFQAAHKARGSSLG